MKELSYKFGNLVELGLKLSRPNEKLTDGAMSELMVLYIEMTRDKDYAPSKHKFLMNYVVYYNHIYLKETHYYLLDELERYLAEKAKVIDFKYDYSTRNELEHDPTAQTWLEQLERFCIRHEVYRGELIDITYMYFYELERLESKDPKYKRLLVEIFTLVHLMRKSVTTYQGKMPLERVYWIPKYNFAKELK